MGKEYLEKSLSRKKNHSGKQIQDFDQKSIELKFDDISYLFHPSKYHLIIILTVSMSRHTMPTKFNPQQDDTYRSFTFLYVSPLPPPSG